MAELSLLSAKFLKQEPGSPGRINRQGFIHPAATMALPFGVKQDLSRRVFGRKGYHHPGANSSNREIGFRILRVLVPGRSSGESTSWMLKNGDRSGSKPESARRFCHALRSEAG